LEVPLIFVAVLLGFTLLPIILSPLPSCLRYAGPRAKGWLVVIDVGLVVFA